MSELTVTRVPYTDIRRSLLLTVSALAFFGVSAPQAKADEKGHPTVWIELGGQLERVSGSQEPFLPPFTPAILEAGFPSPAISERSPAWSFGGEGKVTFTPQDSDWVLSAAIRYGRSGAKHHDHVETSGAPKEIFLSAAHNLDLGPKYPPAVRFEDVTSTQTQTNMVLDFQAGKDVGLGFRGAESTLGLGVRFVQFTAQTALTINADPDFFLPTTLQTPVSRHLYGASSETERNFHGVGPSVAWSASAPFVGNGDTTQVSFDLGVNAAVLFGRQKMREEHKTNGLYNHKVQFPINNFPPVTYHNSPDPYGRSHSVVVPNAGAFAGVSARYSNAKISLGYRGDFFFGAMDGGLVVRDAQTRSFYGPFATISIGFP